MNHVELLVGIAEISVALAGFTGVAVAFGSRQEGSWHPGDRLRLVFLLEASLTAAGFSLLALILLNTPLQPHVAWMILSGTWTIYMAMSLWNSHRDIRENQVSHGDVDRLSNRLTTILFISLMGLQVANVIILQTFYPFLAAIALNVAGAAMQFSRLIRSAFHN